MSQSNFLSQNEESSRSFGLIKLAMLRSARKHASTRVRNDAPASGSGTANLSGRDPGVIAPCAAPSSIEGTGIARLARSGDRLRRAAPLRRICTRKTANAIAPPRRAAPRRQQLRVLTGESKTSITPYRTRS